MELMRNYQLVYDPAAHFLKGILFDPEQGVRQGIVADFIRGPIAPEAVVIELLLTAGQDAAVRQDMQFLRTILNLLEAILVDGKKDVVVFDEVLEIVTYIDNLGYEAFHLEFIGQKQYELGVLNKLSWPQTHIIHMKWLNDRWAVVGGE
jgi:hypothetical protein